MSSAGEIDRFHKDGFPGLLFAVLHRAVKLFALNSGESDDACTTTRKVFTLTPYSRYSKRVRSRSCSMEH